MNETEIRERVRAALGDSAYPPHLTQRVATRLDQPSPRGPSPLLSLVAAILALLIVGTLVFVRIQSTARPLPAVTPHTQPTPQTSPGFTNWHLPEADVAAGQLSGAATRLDITSTSGGRSVTLIGAYADTARTVLVFRSMPQMGFVQASINDQTGFLNGSSTSGAGSAGDEIFILNMGPHPGPDGIAHLDATVNTVQPSLGVWKFSFDLRVQPATALTLSPLPVSLGSWKFSIEALEVTGDTVRFQVVIDGASVDDIFPGVSFTLSDASGKSFRTIGSDAGVTVPKQQLTSTTPKQTRVRVFWSRPDTAGDYTLVIKGGGSEYRGTVAIPAPVFPKPPKGIPTSPTQFPSAPERLTIDGVFAPGSITLGYPTQCGHGTGPSGSIFAFGTYFQVDQAWYLIAFSTDPTVKQYAGPGTYTARALIYPYAPYGADPIFAGTVQLKIDADRGSDRGSVSGTLTWIGAATHPYTVDVSGDWSCMPGPGLGPG